MSADAKACTSQPPKSGTVPATGEERPTPAELAKEMRGQLSWLAHNFEAVTEGDTETYEVNSARAQILALMALANDVADLAIDKPTAGSETQATGVEAAPWEPDDFREAVQDTYGHDLFDRDLAALERAAGLVALAVHYPHGGDGYHTEDLESVLGILSDVRTGFGLLRLVMVDAGLYPDPEAAQ